MLIYEFAQDIMDGSPTHLGLVNPQYTVGHNVVVDGYNTDEFFHFNFGWGGNSNGWYTMPPSSTPYNLTVIEGIVIDILGNNPHVSIAESSKSEKKIEVRFHQRNLLTVISLSSDAIKPEINIFDVHGRLLHQESLFFSAKGENYQIALPHLSRGLFIVHIFYGVKGPESFKFVKMN